jgi:hypothetical protein
MTDPRAADTTPLNPPQPDDLDGFRRELTGEEAPADQDGILASDQVELREPPTDEEVNADMAGAMGTLSRIDEPESLEMLEDLDLRSDETSDPNLAAEEGLAWVPPIDPPVVASDNPEGIAIAAGFGTSALDDPYDADHHSSVLTDEDEMTGRVREALRADATTTEYADTIGIETDGDRVILRGVVEDLEDDDNLVAVASTVTGVGEVIDRLTIATL